MVGAAANHLTNWSRGTVVLVRRLRSAHGSRTKEEATREPTPEQRQVLNAVLAYFLENGRRAPFRLLDKLLDREAIPLRKNAESMPPGLLTPDVALRGGFFYADDELMVTLEGLRYCDGGVRTLDLLARVLAYMAKLEKGFMPTMNEPNLFVRSQEVCQALNLSTLELTQARLLLDEIEPHVWTSGTLSENGNWSFTLDLERVRRFRGIHDGEEYLLARRGETSFAERLDEKEAELPQG